MKTIKELKLSNLAGMTLEERVKDAKNKITKERLLLNDRAKEINKLSSSKNLSPNQIQKEYDRLDIDENKLSILELKLKKAQSHLDFNKQIEKLESENNDIREDIKYIEDK